MSTEIRYTLEIDEEGYPVFDGLRVFDEELLRMIFGNLKRLESEKGRAALITTCEGEKSYVVGFSDPLVAQSVEILGTQKSRWYFLGEIFFDVELSEIKEDPWQRLHAYVGPQRIPAVLSRKAQADFLLKSDFKEDFVFPVWRETSKSLSQADDWESYYDKGETGWELGKVSPVLEKHWEKTKAAFSSGAKLLVPGAGRGHEAAFLQEQSLSVTALDFAPSAKEDFSKLYPQSKVSFELADIFEYLNSHKNFYDGIFEHTLFCAINPARREEYIQKTFLSLKAGGLWFGIFFIHTYEGGPPFGITPWELREMTQKKFTYLEWAISPHSVKPRRGQELWVVMKRKD